NEVVTDPSSRLGLHPGALRLQFPGLAISLRATGGQVLLAVIFLVEQARVLLDAIVRTLVRLGLTRRNLLEWETAATTERRLGSDFLSFSLTMWPAPFLAVSLACLIAVVRAEALPAAL